MQILHHGARKSPRNSDFVVSTCCQPRELGNARLWSHPGIVFKPRVNSSSLLALSPGSSSVLGQKNCVREEVTNLQLSHTSLKPAQGSYLAKGAAPELFTDLTKALLCLAGHHQVPAGKDFPSLAFCKGLGSLGTLQVLGPWPLLDVRALPQHLDRSALSTHREQPHHTRPLRAEQENEHTQISNNHSSSWRKQSSFFFFLSKSGGDKPKESAP